MDAQVTKQARTSASVECTPADWSKAYHNSQFQNLVRFKKNRIRPAVLLYFLGYVLLSGLAGFAPGFMAIKLIGSFSLGYALILLTYFIAWGVALWYVHTADAEFDPLKLRAIRSIEMEGPLR